MHLTAIQKSPMQQFPQKPLRNFRFAGHAKRRYQQEHNVFQ